MKIKGLDISIYQKGMSFNIARGQGYKFMILRGGYTTNGGVRKRRKDLEFSHFYDKCQKYGIRSGVYYYSCAQNYNEGKQDAIFLYNECLKGRLFEIPIYIDVEDSYMLKAGRRGCTDAVHGFCQTLEGLGYFAGFYTGYYTLTEYMIPSELLRYTFWGAWWKDNQNPPKALKDFSNFKMWQHSGGGERIGSYNVDGDICYEDFPHIIRVNELNGWKEVLHGKI